MPKSRQQAQQVPQELAVLLEAVGLEEAQPYLAKVEVEEDGVLPLGEDEDREGPLDG